MWVSSPWESGNAARLVYPSPFTSRESSMTAKRSALLFRCLDYLDQFEECQFSFQ